MQKCRLPYCVKNPWSFFVDTICPLRLALTALLVGSGTVAAAPLPECPPKTHAVGKAPPDGVEWRCETAGGVAEGPWLRWYDNGQPMSESHMKNGLEHGRQRAWWPNGQLMLEGVSVEGNRYKGFKYWGIDGTPTDLGIKPDTVERAADK